MVPSELHALRAEGGRRSLVTNHSDRNLKIVGRGPSEASNEKPDGKHQSFRDEVSKRVSSRETALYGLSETGKGTKSGLVDMDQ